MSREIPISSSHQKVFRRSWAESRWHSIKTAWDSLHPTKRIEPPEFSDRSRPAWMIHAIGAWDWGFARYPSASIWPWGGQDIAIEEIEYAVYRRSDPVGFINSPVIIYTPDISYVPFSLSTLYWTPAVRPRQEFDLSNTVVVTGTNPLVYGAAGYWNHTQCTSPGGSGYAIMNRITFNPPLILEGYMFLTLQYASIAIAADLYTNWRYREIG